MRGYPKLAIIIQFKRLDCFRKINTRISSPRLSNHTNVGKTNPSLMIGKSTTEFQKR